MKKVILALACFIFLSLLSPSLILADVTCGDGSLDYTITDNSDGTLTFSIDVRNAESPSYSLFLGDAWLDQNCTSPFTAGDPTDGVVTCQVDKSTIENAFAGSGNFTLKLIYGTDDCNLRIDRSVYDAAVASGSTPPPGSTPSPTPTPACTSDFGSSGVDTALGCIPTQPAELVKWILKYAIFIGGGIAFLLSVFGGISIILAGGNPEKINAGKEIITSALTGLLFIVFSIFLLRLIGFNIFQLPGFSQ